MSNLEFTRDFQIKLLINLLRDDRFFSDTVGLLHLDDFGFPPCRLVYEVARKYYTKFRKPIPFTTLEHEIVRAIHDLTGSFETRLNPAELDSLATVMGWIANTPANELDSKYFMARLSDYLAFVRLSRMPNPGSVNAKQYIDEVTALQKELSLVGGTGGYEFINANSPLPEETGSCRERIGFGISNVDYKMGGGLNKGQFGLIVACSGVGKSTTMVNMMSNAMLDGWHTLLITNELPAWKMVERNQMITAGIPAEYYKMGRSRWPKEMRDRWEFLTSPKCPITGSLTVIERIGCCTVPDVDRIVHQWKEKIERSGQDPAKCGIVGVDWLGRIDHSATRGLTRNDGDERKNFRAIEMLVEYAFQHDVVMWGAAQAKITMRNKEVLDMSDISWGTSQNHLLDASVAVAPKYIEKSDKDDGIGFDEDEDKSMQGTASFLSPPCDRELVFSFPKLRDASSVGGRANVYQGPTLRLWNKKETMISREEQVKRYGLRETFRMAGNMIWRPDDSKPSPIGGSTSS